MTSASLLEDRRAKRRVIRHEVVSAPPRVVMEAACATCGTQLKPDAKFCGQCGAPLTKADTEAATAQGQDQ